MERQSAVMTRATCFLVVGLGLSAFALLNIPFAQPARGKSGTGGFPVPRVEAEFRHAVCAAVEVALGCA